MVNYSVLLAHLQRTLALAGVATNRLSLLLVQVTETGLEMDIHLSSDPHWFHSLLSPLSKDKTSQALTLFLTVLQNRIDEGLLEQEYLVWEEGAQEPHSVRFIAFYANPIEPIPSFLSHLLKTYGQKLLHLPDFLTHTSPDSFCRNLGFQLLSSSLGSTQAIGASLFLSLDKICLSPYESKYALGTIYLFDSIESADQIQIRLKQLVPFNNTRGVRKLLEIGDRELCLYATEEGIFGLGAVPTEGLALASIDFPANTSWLFKQHGRYLFQVYAGIPSVYTPQLTKPTFLETVKAVFKDLSKEQLEFLYKLIAQVVNQPNGTNILITEQAAMVVEHLEAQTTVIEPILLSPDLLQRVSRIDGTVVIDPRGICFGIGAILDGQAARLGNPARGGRYNSAVMFCENSPYPCMIMVVSQDGTVDLVHSA